MKFPRNPSHLYLLANSLQKTLNYLKRFPKNCIKIPAKNYTKRVTTQWKKGYKTKL